MKILKKVLSFIIISIFLLNSIKNITYASQVNLAQKPIKVGVFLVDLSNAFNSDFKKNLEEIQKENEDKIQFTIFDSNANQAIQNEDIAKGLAKGFNLFVIGPVSSNEDEIRISLDKIIQAKMPFILFFPTTPSLTNIVTSYPASAIITGDTEQGGTLQGKILADAWNANKKTFDKNKDNILQYVMLQGPSNNILTLDRSKYSIRALNETGIKTEQLFSTVCNWQKDCAESAIESVFLTLADKIEAIISNNDNMAIGAVEALQKYGYNTSDSSKFIPIVGIGGVAEAKELIRQGAMTGTAVQDSKLYAKAIYAVAMNLASGKSPLQDTDYKFDETGVTIKIPYYEYVKQSKIN